MTSAEASLRDVLTYGGSRRHGLLALVVGLALCAVGVWMVADATKSGDLLLGIAIVLIGAAVLAVGIAGMRGPDMPTLSLSPDGIQCTDISDKLIPWSEIVAVDTRTEMQPGELLSWRCVTSIAVSKPFFDRLGSLMPLSSAPAVALYEFINLPRKYSEVVEVDGEDVRIPIARFVLWPRSQRLHEAVVSRWRLFRSTTTAG